MIRFNSMRFAELFRFIETSPFLGTLTIAASVLMDMFRRGLNSESARDRSSTVQALRYIMPVELLRTSVFTKNVEETSKFLKTGLGSLRLTSGVYFPWPGSPAETAGDPYGAHCRAIPVAAISTMGFNRSDYSGMKAHLMFGGATCKKNAPKFGVHQIFVETPESVQL